MTPAILASGTERRASLGMAAAVAVEGAALTGAGTLLVELGEGAQRRGPTLLAAPAARRIEEALRRAGPAGVGPRAHLPPGRARGRGGPRGGSGAIAVGEAELIVVHLPGRLWVPALEFETCRSRAAACSSPCRPNARSQRSPSESWSDAGCRFESQPDRRDRSPPAGRSPALARAAAPRSRPGGSRGDSSVWAESHRERAARVGARRAGPAGPARRRPDPDPRRAGAGGDRRRRDRPRAGAAGRRPGRALRGPQHARRRPAAAGARKAAGRRAEPATPRPRRVPLPRAPRGGRCRAAKPSRSRPPADRLSRRRREPAASRPRHDRRGGRPGAAPGRRAPRGPLRSGWSRAPSPRPRPR